MLLPACFSKGKLSRIGLLLGICSSLLLMLQSGVFGQDSDLESRITIDRVVDDDSWGNRLRNPSCVFYDVRAEELFVTDGSNGRVLIYDYELNFKFAFPHFIQEKGTRRTIRGEPRQLVVNSLGEIILADNLADHLDVLDYRGKLLDRIHLDRLLGDTSLTVKASVLAIDSKDNLYIATAGDIVTVMVINDRLELAFRFGQKGTGPDDFNTVLALEVWQDLIITADLYAEPAIKIFDSAGVFQYGFGGHDVGRGDLSFPSGLTVVQGLTNQPLLWVIDGLRQTIKVFSLQGGFEAGAFRYPIDIANAGDSTLYILERVGARIQRFRLSPKN